ncbi:MAG TPA: hypothetical protein VKA55_05320 [Gammaproteobacteria bacterium]|nr:hypothetical protein [Gammaproteobacteria bacterium]
MADVGGQIEALNYAVAQLYTTFLMETDAPQEEARDLREQWSTLELPAEDDPKADFFWEFQSALDHLAYLIQDMVAEETGGEPPRD